MKAVTYQDVKNFQVIEVPDPVVQDPTDVVVRITRAAICGSDLHLYHGTIPGMLPGAIVGHEYTGVVDAIGSQVRGLAIGNRVVGTFHIACGLCPSCRRGNFHQCSNGGVLGYGLAFGNLNGTQAEYVRVPYGDVNLRKIPDGMDDEKALFCGDILTTAYGAVRNAGINPGETVAVIGAGPVGIMVVLSALTLGASRVLSIDLMAERAHMAAEYGAIPIVSSEVNPVRKVLELTGGEGADVVIEAVGGSRTLEMAFQLVRGGGRISAVGVTAEEELKFPLMSALTRDLTFRIGVANIHRDIDATLSLVAAGRIDPTVVVSHRMSLDEASEGYRLFHDRIASKVIVTP